MAGVSGSAALIGVLQSAKIEPLTKAILSCIAPAVIELSIFLYQILSRQLIARLSFWEREKEREKESQQRQKEQDTRLEFARQYLQAAMNNPLISREDKDTLQRDFAQGEAALARVAIHAAFTGIEIEPPVPTQESATA